MFQVELPLTDTEQAALEAMAASSGASVGELLAAWVREELEDVSTPLVPNLG